MTAHIDIDDPRLTAYALGELPADEMTEMAAAVAADPRLQAEIAAIRAFGATLEDELGAEPAPELGAAARAAIVTAGDGPPANDDGAPEVLARRWYARPRFLVAAGLFLAAGTAAALALSSGTPGTTPTGGADTVLSERVETRAPDEMPAVVATEDAPTPAEGQTNNEAAVARVAPADPGRLQKPEEEAAGTEIAETTPAPTDEPEAPSTATSSPVAQWASPNGGAAGSDPKVGSSSDLQEPVAPRHADGTPWPDANRNGIAYGKRKAAGMGSKGIDAYDRANAPLAEAAGATRALGVRASSERARLDALGDDGDFHSLAGVVAGGTATGAP
ncbi:MAG: hypothetical protein EP329_06225, partial [Deltaproteobacteria bacterium]